MDPIEKYFQEIDKLIIANAEQQDRQDRFIENMFIAFLIVVALAGLFLAFVA